MITECIRYRVPEARAAAFEEACRRAAVALQVSPLCRTYDLERCEEDPESYLLRITWTSTEDGHGGFREREEFRDVVAEVEGQASGVAEARTYRPVAIVPSLYDWAGGAEAFEALFTAFYDRVAEDPVLAPVFAGMNPAHPRHVAAWLGEVLGGPKVYSERHGGHPHMVSRHVGRALTEQQRRAWVSLLLDTADQVGLPGDAEFRSAFAGYLEWGTRMALMFSQPGVDAAVPEPMPGWGWGEVRPWPR